MLEPTLGRGNFGDSPKGSHSFLAIWIFNKVGFSFIFLIAVPVRHSKLGRGIGWTIRKMTEGVPTLWAGLIPTVLGGAGSILCGPSVVMQFRTLNLRKQTVILCQPSYFSKLHSTYTYVEREREQWFCVIWILPMRVAMRIAFDLIGHIW